MPKALPEKVYRLDQNLIRHKYIILFSFKPFCFSDSRCVIVV